MILDFFIPLIAAYFSSGMAEYWFFPMIALAFLVTVPCIIRDIALRRSH